MHRRTGPFASFDAGQGGEEDSALGVWQQGVQVRIKNGVAWDGERWDAWDGVDGVDGPFSCTPFLQKREFSWIIKNILKRRDPFNPHGNTGRRRREDRQESKRTRKIIVTACTRLIRALIAINNNDKWTTRIRDSQQRRQ